MKKAEINEVYNRKTVEKPNDTKPVLRKKIKLLNLAVFTHTHARTPQTTNIRKETGLSLLHSLTGWYCKCYALNLTVEKSWINSLEILNYQTQDDMDNLNGPYIVIEDDVDNLN